MLCKGVLMQFSWVSWKMSWSVGRQSAGAIVTEHLVSGCVPSIVCTRIGARRPHVKGSNDSKMGDCWFSSVHFMGALGRL